MKERKTQMQDIRCMWISVFGLAVFLICACTGSLMAKEETPGEHFDRAMKEFAEHCAKVKPKPNDRSCDRLKLKPADPLATEEGRFAHSIKLPDPLPEDSGYRPGITPEEYFKHLCKREAGEFIYRTVDNVQGFYMMRPRQKATDYELENLYALEDPYGEVLGVVRQPQDTYVQPALGKYDFLEIPQQNLQPEKQVYKRYYRDENAQPGRKYQTAENGQGVFVPYIVAETDSTTIKSRYGYTWRGISRPHDREFGIAGGEVIVLDLQTKEVLAARRGFIRSGWMKNMTGIWWLSGQVCNNLGKKQEHLFIKEILKPKPSAVTDRGE